MLKPIEIALSQYGTHDILGSQSNPEVLKYYAKVAQSWVSNDDTSWCAAFVGYCLEMAGLHSTLALNARSYLTWGIATTKPKVGDIAVFWRIAKDSVYGHVTFFIKEEGNQIYCLGGNQSDAVNITVYPKDKLLGYRTY